MSQKSHLPGQPPKPRSVAPAEPVEKPVVAESLGRRIAQHRAKLGWTQQELADRVAVSRVTVSHLEAGLSEPGERTVALLAGVFKVEPHELVAGTAYPSARAERLPVVVAQYTEVEFQLALLDADLRGLEPPLADGTAPAGAPTVAPAAGRLVLERWLAKLELLLDTAHDKGERAAVRAAHQRVRAVLGGNR